ncbi:MAG: alpha-L-glutamate ligase-like protein [bacterium]
MRRWFARARALRARGVLGINERNGGFVLPLNPRKHYPNVDDKLLTKRLAEAAGLPTPRLLGVIAYQHQLRDLPALLDGREQFVLKPARGAQGNGIVVVTHIEADGRYRKSSGALLTPLALRQHVSNTISGVFSLRGDADACLIEQRVILHAAFHDLTRFGIPDIRVVVYRGVPVMAMCRLPTTESDGRANLHQGAIGAGIAICDGRATHAAIHNTAVTHHVDTQAPIVGFQVPQWDAVLALAVRAAEMSGLGYLGVDIVIDAGEGPQLLELNARPGLAIQIANNQGLLPRLRRADALPAAARATWTDRLAAARALF